MACGTKISKDNKEQMENEMQARDNALGLFKLR